MQWTHSESASHGDDGMIVVREPDGWHAYPFGIETGSVGRYVSREAAMAAAEDVAASVLCCADRDDACDA
jgi:hypothetical protein